MRELNVAVVQMAVKFNDVEANLVAISEWIRRVATEQKVDLIVFPNSAPPATNAACASSISRSASPARPPT